ncbi:hypothetical protein T492DRAFT_865378 [Pavlovales sp. CCMP2436]|nr:hypothetical protein T492DRAFT_865378 [Pavlovales sp. CCMP2436]
MATVNQSPMQQTNGETAAPLADAVRTELLGLSSELGSDAALCFVAPGAAGALALAGFELDGELSSGNLPACAFNDLYKWSMLPVIRSIERDHAPERDALARAAAEGGTLHARVNWALSALSRRLFDRSVFMGAAEGLGLDAQTVDSICGPAGCV